MDNALKRLPVKELILILGYLNAKGRYTAEERNIRNTVENMYLVRETREVY